MGPHRSAAGVRRSLLRSLGHRVVLGLALPIFALCGGCGNGEQPKLSSAAPPVGAVAVPYNLGNGTTCSPSGDTCLPCFVGGSIRACPSGWRYQDSFIFEATNGSPPYSWTAASLPPGLTVSTDGSIRGEPTSEGTYAAAITVTDSSVPSERVTSTVTFAIDAPPPPTIATSAAAAKGAINQRYINRFTVTNGQTPLTWSETGTLPAGLTFASDGTLSGTPTVAGAFPITLMVQDASGQTSAPQDVTIEVLSHGFRATAAMGTARTLHTATLLNSGSVLIAGGFDGTRGLSTAEVFDPASATFTTTGDPSGGRYLHSATLLKSGRVLLTGGLFEVADTPVATAELFDPVNDRFTSAGNLRVARYAHGATLLDNGTVLITGGFGDGNAALDSAEIYDPITNRFISVASMTTARAAHTATLLSNGDVLVVGGIADREGAALNTAEIYDPARQRFTATGSMLDARAHHAATRLSNGDVLVAGGVVGNAIATAEIYDSATGTFSSTSDMRTAHSAPTVTLLDDGTVLLTGGGDDRSNLVADAELYDAVDGTFAATGSMTTARDGHSATLLQNGQVLVTGGSNGSILSTTELYR